MKNITISLAKTTIFGNVGLNTAYLGAKTSGSPSSFEQVATIAEDASLLSRFWLETCALVADKLKEFISSSSLSDDNFSITLNVSGNYDDSLTPAVKEEIHAAVVDGVTGRWFQYTGPQRASVWIQNSAECLERAVSKLCQRRKPTRRNV